MASKNVETFRTAHQAFNSRDFDGVVSRMTEDAVYEDRARGATFAGRDGFREFMQAWVAAFSDAAITEPVYTDGGSTVIVEFIGRGTNDGSLAGLPATSRSMRLPFCEIVRFNDQGQIVSGAVYYDQLSLLTQLGLTQAAGAASAG